MSFFIAKPKSILSLAHHLIPPTLSTSLTLLHSLYSKPLIPSNFILPQLLNPLRDSICIILKMNPSQTPSPYTKLSSKYNQSQLQPILKLLRKIAYSCLYNGKYPVLKLLKAVCRKLLINQFESILLAHVLQSNKWNLRDPVIEANFQRIGEIYSYSGESSEYKSLTFYLLLCAYTVKYYSVEDIKVFDEEMNRICENFGEIFESWAKQYAQTTLKINPKNLNKIYKTIYLARQEFQVEFDFNSLVDNLLQISPSYSSEKSEGQILIQISPNKSKLTTKRTLDTYQHQDQSSFNSPQNLFFKLNHQNSASGFPMLIEDTIPYDQTKEQCKYNDEIMDWQRRYEEERIEEGESDCELLFRKKISTMSTMSGFMASHRYY